MRSTLGYVMSIHHGLSTWSSAKDKKKRQQTCLSQGKTSRGKAAIHSSIDVKVPQFLPFVFLTPVAVWVWVELILDKKA